MASMEMERVKPQLTSLVITNAESTSPAIDLDGVAGALLTTPAADWTSATVTVYAFCPAEGTYKILRKLDGTGDVTFTAGLARAVPLPDEIYAARRIKLVTNQAGNNAMVCGLSLTS